MKRKHHKHSSSLFRDNNISTGCDRDQKLPLVHTKIFFNEHFHRHLVTHITLPAECKHTHTPVRLSVGKLMRSVRHSDAALYMLLADATQSRPFLSY